MTTEYIDGQKVTYDIVGQDVLGNDIKENYTIHTDITYVDGQEYPISPVAPEPVVYGVKLQVLSVREGANIEASMELYDYTKDKYYAGVPVPASVYVNCEPHIPPSIEDQIFTENWDDVEYKRNIVVPETLEMGGLISAVSTYVDKKRHTALTKARNK